MKAVYLVGPSGSGKSTLCKSLAAGDAQLIHISLDKEVKRIAPDFRIRNIEDWDIRWTYCKQALDELLRSAAVDQIYLIDTGAGALQTAEGRAYFIGHSSHMICLNGEPKVIYERNSAKFIAQRRQARPYIEFYDDEFSVTRQSIYSAAKVTIDTTVIEEFEGLEALRKAIEKVLSDPTDKHIGGDEEKEI